MARLDFYGNQMLSRPVDIEFAGFHSDTHTLQRHGWAFTVDQDQLNSRIRVIGRHDQFDLSLYAEGNQFDFESAMFHYREQTPPRLRIMWVRPTKNVLVRESINMLGFAPVDMTPQYLGSNERPLREFQIFAPLQPETREIIVEPKDVQECLSLIERLQAPQLAEIRKRNAQRERSEAVQRGTVHAQVIALAA